MYLTNYDLSGSYCIVEHFTFALREEDIVIWPNYYSRFRIWWSYYNNDILYLCIDTKYLIIALLLLLQTNTQALPAKMYVSTMG